MDKKNIKQNQRGSLAGSGTLRGLLHSSRTTWIEQYAKEFAEEEGIGIEAKHYTKGTLILGNAFLVNELDTSLKNLFRTLKMVAHRGICVRGDGGYGRDVFYGVLDGGREYSVERQTRGGGDYVNLNISDLSFRISDESFLNSGRELGNPGLTHYGSKIPENILTQILDGEVDEDRIEKRRREYESSILPPSISV